jgi:enediyne biosynthesis protein E4
MRPPRPGLGSSPARRSSRRALQQLVADAPAEFAAWDRLADLALQAGHFADAAEFRRRKAELDQASDRYQERLGRNQPIRDALELARLAEQLGRWFEARVFLTLTAEIEPTRGGVRETLAGLDRRDVVEARPGCTLAELLATELDTLAAGSVIPTTIPKVGPRRRDPASASWPAIAPDRQGQAGPFCASR